MLPYASSAGASAWHALRAQDMGNCAIVTQKACEPELHLHSKSFQQPF